MLISSELNYYHNNLTLIEVELQEHFGKERFSDFIDGLHEHNCFIIFDKGCTHIPGRITKWSHSINKGSRPTPPKGYKLWLHIFEEFSGMHYYLFYPKGAKTGDFIKVLFHGCNFYGFFNWEHGEKGLFDPVVYVWLLMESFIYSNDSEFVDYIEKAILAVKYGEIR